MQLPFHPFDPFGSVPFVIDADRRSRTQTLGAMSEACIYDDGKRIQRIELLNGPSVKGAMQPAAEMPIKAVALSSGR